MKIIDETNNIYNDLKVIGRDMSKTGRKYWFCECQKCKQIFSISGTDLRTGKKNKCPNCHSSTKELIGKRFGKLTVINFSHKSSDRRLYWICKCDCGNIETISSKSLKTHTRTQCIECGKRSRAAQYINEIGNTYGLLKVIAYDKEKSGKNAYWICQCKCGNQISVQGSKLRDRHTKSCGCIKSYGEETIIQLLKENNIKFETQKTFNNCKFPNTNALAKFDFYINNKYLIEYDGQQHFYPIDLFGGEKTLQSYKERDIFKNQWCKDNNIPLIRIPYTYLKNICIEDLLLETSKFII